jgi:hypothetical protein
MGTLETDDVDDLFVVSESQGSLRAMCVMSVMDVQDSSLIR